MAMQSISQKATQSMPEYHSSPSRAEGRNMFSIKYISICSFLIKHRISLLYDLCAALLLIATLLFHIYLVANGYPQTNSDESTMGLMARHILYQGKPILMFYG